MIKLALRNCLRNRKRTIVTGLSVMLAVFVVLMIMSFMYSCFDQLAVNERKYTTGDIRIRNTRFNEFESLMPMQFFIEDYSSGLPPRRKLMTSSKDLLLAAKALSSSFWRTSSRFFMSFSSSATAAKFGRTDRSARMS